MKTRAKLAIATLSLCLPLPSLADAPMVFQDCFLEGKVVPDREGDGNNIVRVDFYKAQSYTDQSRCIIDGFLKFKQPKGSLIENLSVGSVVQYRYIKMTNGTINWQLVGAFI